MIAGCLQHHLQSKKKAGKCVSFFLEAQDSYSMFPVSSAGNLESQPVAVEMLPLLKDDVAGAKLPRQSRQREACQRTPPLQDKQILLLLHENKQPRPV